MNLRIAEMIEEKIHFVKAIETMLAADQANNMVDCLLYKVEIQDENCYDEYIDVVYINGHTKRILVTRNSNGANLRSIVKEVYR